MFITPKIIHGDKNVLDEPMTIKGEPDPRKPVIVQTGVGQSLPFSIKTNARGQKGSSFDSGALVQTGSSSDVVMPTAVAKTPQVSL